MLSGNFQCLEQLMPLQDVAMRFQAGIMTSGPRDLGTSGPRDLGHRHTSDSSSKPPGHLKLSLPGLRSPARRRLTASSLKHKPLQRKPLQRKPLQRKRLKRKLRPLSFRSLNPNPLKLRPLNWAAALAACCPLWPSSDGTPTPIKSVPQRGPYANRR